MAGQRAMEQARLQRLLRKLLNAPSVAFPRKGTVRLPQLRHGVYVIRSPHGTVRHVGSTYRVSAGTQQRLRNHLNGQSSFALAHRTLGGLGGDGRLLRSGFTYQYIAVNHPRTRHLLEHLAIGTLCPKYIGTHAHRPRAP
ncbi:MAG TPA: hypothetical protein VM327_03235 [Candidatus Thermoplasmatota archaeon]|nr:hypothetical protein [Candidatus Thermoplasmatota archaeon]